MYRVFAASRVVLNRHISVAEGYANNMRLYEATGVGAALLTDSGHNLTDLFEPEREVATYRDAGDAVARAQRLLEDEPARSALAEAGQARTLREHTMARRMSELAGVLEESLTLRRAA
jgi:spore maturation protein CgeB